MIGTAPRIIVVSGPSGVGKGTLVSKVLLACPDVVRSVSCTTRAPRPGEREGVDYHFVSAAAFDRLVAEDAFLEWAWVHGNRYGTLEESVDLALEAGASPILEIDVQGAKAIRARRPDALLVFVEPPSMEELRLRLEKRDTEDAPEVERRLDRALQELDFRDCYDARITNDDLEQATRELIAIIENG